MSEFIRLTAELRGVVQGVGFRPTLYRLAREAGLGGWVQNRSGTVRLVLEGPAETVRRFLPALPARLPQQARLDRVQVLSEEPLPDSAAPADFVIRESEGGDVRRIAIPADLALCAACRREIFDPADRRHGYPFTTCTDCGPRYTVVEAMPYDRERTTMRVFPLCADCDREYRTPSDRRFHAESIACPKCGPRLTLADAAGRVLPGDPLRLARAALAEGKIVAVRGIGGFLIACDAFHRGALATLRARKTRPHKPFAVMAASLDVVRRHCETPDAAADVLASPQAPIVILDLRAAATLPRELLAPDADTLGVMLPTSPLHSLLLAPLPGDPTPPFELLVMTSGNRGGEPICLTNAEALERLGAIADLFLLHDREINLRNDDSLVALQRGAPQLWRRARGYAPEAVALHRPLARRVLAMGAELKNTIAVGAGAEVFLSPHVGDLEAPEAVEGLRQVVESLPRFLELAPEVVAVDLHPDLHSTRLGRDVAGRLGLPVVEVQHHHAHAAACMAEHGLDEALALVFDGTGLGPDGTIWGAELLHVAPGRYARLGTFAAVPLPGGDAAVAEPRRQLVARWLAAGLEIPPAWLERLMLDEGRMHLWRAQIQRRIHTPLTRGAGRLFDAFAVALGVAPERTTYEGQSAIRLEACARRAAGRPDRFPAAPFAAVERDGLLEVDWSELFRFAAELPPGPPEPLAFAFHEAVAEAAARMAEYGIARTGVREVVVSGGVFMNRLLNEQLFPRLGKLGAKTSNPWKVPPNDGGIALGQAVIAGGG